MAPRKSFLLRISAELWDELSRWAADDFRSVNGQIEYILQRAVDERRGRRREPADPGAEERRDERAGLEAVETAPDE